jgi:hypothetical protein
LIQEMDMNLVSKPMTTRLGRRGMLTLRASAGDRIDCLDGSVWITQEGDPRDIVLGASQSFTLDRAGTTIVEALREGVVALRPAVPPALTIAADPESRASRAGRRPLSFAVPALAATAAWLFIALGLPVGELQQAPRPSLPAVELAHAGQAWPQPPVHDKAAPPAKPVPAY